MYDAKLPEGNGASLDAAAARQASDSPSNQSGARKAAGNALGTAGPALGLLALVAGAACAHPGIRELAVKMANDQKLRGELAKLAKAGGTAVAESFRRNGGPVVMKDFVGSLMKS